jgi:hypothetical protein
MCLHQDLGLAPSLLSLILNQKYVGDVTIVPPMTFEGYSHIISNPSFESFERFVKVLAAHWQHISNTLGTHTQTLPHNQQPFL